MTEIEQKALELVNEAALDDEPWTLDDVLGGVVFKALCRAIEQHEAFRQEVSDAVERFWPTKLPPVEFKRFILPNPDPLVDAFASIGTSAPEYAAENLRAALAKRGGRIVFDD